jgi:hypothetical protein
MQKTVRSIARMIANYLLMLVAEESRAIDAYYRQFNRREERHERYR